MGVREVGMRTVYQGGGGREGGTEYGEFKLHTVSISVGAFEEEGNIITLRRREGEGGWKMGWEGGWEEGWWTI